MSLVPRPTIPGTVNALTRPDTPQEGAAAQTMPYGGRVNRQAETNKMVNKGYSPNITPASEELFAEIYRTTKISPNDIATKIPGQVFAYFFGEVTAQGQAARRNLGTDINIYEHIAAVDCFTTCMPTPSSLPADDNEFDALSSIDKARIGRFHKFYEIVSDAQMPTPGSLMTVRYLDANPRAYGVVIRHDVPATSPPLVITALQAMNVASVSSTVGNVRGSPKISKAAVDVSASPSPPGRRVNPTLWTMTRGELKNWANSLGVSDDLLLIAITLHSEVARKEQKEQEVIFNTIINRIGVNSTLEPAGKKAFGVRGIKENTAWSIINTSAVSTGRQGVVRKGVSRQYASSRPPKGDTLSLFLTKTAVFLQNRIKNGDMSGGVTNYQHRAANWENVHKRWTGADLKHVGIGGFNTSLVRFYIKKSAKYQATETNPKNETLQASIIRFAELALGALRDKDLSVPASNLTTADVRQRVASISAELSLPPEDSTSSAAMSLPPEDSTSSDAMSLPPEDS